MRLLSAAAILFSPKAIVVAISSVRGGAVNEKEQPFELAGNENISGKGLLATASENGDEVQLNPKVRGPPELKEDRLIPKVNQSGTQHLRMREGEDAGEDEQFQYGSFKGCPHNTPKWPNEEDWQWHGTEYDPCVADVVIVGGGVAGLAAAAHFKKNDPTWNVIVLDARDAGTAYGRIEKSNFFGLPNGVGIDLGAEFVHTGYDSGKYFDDDDGSRADNTYPGSLIRDLLTDINDNPKSYMSGNPKRHRLMHYANEDWMWKDFTWYDFVKEEIVDENKLEPYIINGFTVNEVERKWELVDEDDAFIEVRGKFPQDSNKDYPYVFKAEYVIVTVPINQLQKNRISFTPTLRDEYQNAIKSYQGQNAVKGWIEVDCAFENDGPELANDHPLAFWYDETGRVSNTDDRHIVGFFAESKAVSELGLDNLSDGELATELTKKLNNDGWDVTGKAIAKNWKKVAHIEQAYTDEFGNAPINALKKNYFQGRLQFAGEGIAVGGENDTGMVHTAGNSGKAAAKKIENSWCTIVKDCGANVKEAVE